MNIMNVKHYVEMNQAEIMTLLVKDIHRQITDDFGFCPQPQYGGSIEAGDIYVVWSPLKMKFMLHSGLFQLRTKNTIVPIKTMHPVGVMGMDHITLYWNSSAVNLSWVRFSANGKILDFRTRQGRTIEDVVFDAAASGIWIRKMVDGTIEIEGASLWDVPNIPIQSEKVDPGFYWDSMVNKGYVPLSEDPCPVFV